MGDQTAGNQHLRGRTEPGRLSDTQFGFLHETRLADSLDAHTSLKKWMGDPDLT